MKNIANSLAIAVVALGAYGCEKKLEKIVPVSTADQLSSFCNFQAVLPMRKEVLRLKIGNEALRVSWEQNGRGPGNGDIFPLKGQKLFSNKEPTEAAYLICPTKNLGLLSSFSPRFAFYFDADGELITIEARHLFTSL